MGADEIREQLNAQALSARPRHRRPVRTRPACSARQRAAAFVLACVMCLWSAGLLRARPHAPPLRGRAGGGRPAGKDDAAGRSRCGDERAGPVSGIIHMRYQNVDGGGWPRPRALRAAPDPQRP
jgi:hypothetical protein